MSLDLVTPFPKLATLQKIMLKELLRQDIDALTAWVEWKDGISFQLRYISRAKMGAIVKRCQVWKYDNDQKTRNQVVDGDRLTEEYCKESVLDWKGLTTRTASTLIPMDFSAVPEEKLDDEIPFSQEELLVLVKNAYDIDGFLQKVAPDLGYFKPNQDAELKNSAASQSGS